MFAELSREFASTVITNKKKVNQALALFVVTALAGPLSPLLSLNKLILVLRSKASPDAAGGEPFARGRAHSSLCQCYFVKLQKPLDSG